MTTLYRSPSHIIDDHEWYGAVEKQRNGRNIIVYRFRPIHDRKQFMWSNIGEWQGRLPKGLKDFFQPYRKHMEIAMRPVEQRRRLGQQVAA